jgi:acyl-coenzyme A thioesterase PaaI-like protein
MVGTARGGFVFAVADVFISLFNDNGANKQSQIKINFLRTPL